MSLAKSGIRRKYICQHYKCIQLPRKESGERQRADVCFSCEDENEEKGCHDPVGIDVRDVENVPCLLTDLLKDDDASIGEWIVDELNGGRLSSVPKWKYDLNKLAGKRLERHTFVKASLAEVNLPFLFATVNYLTNFTAVRKEWIFTSDVRTA